MAASQPREGVEGLVRGLANELRGRNICVNAGAPRPVNTPPMTAGKSEQQMEELGKMGPMQRTGKPADIARRIFPGRA